MKTPRISDLVELILQNRLNEFHTCIPGRIVEYDATKQEATVQPLIKRRYYDAGPNADGIQEQPPIVAVPVVFPSAGTGILSFPVKVGDIVLILFSERSLDNWLFSDGASLIDPQDHRQFNYSDAIAIPGIYPFQKALGGSTTDVELRMNSGTASECKVALKPNGDVVITSPAKVIVNSTGNTEVNAANVNVTASTSTFNGNVSVTGDISCSGTVTGTTDVVGGGKSLKTHTHTSASPGSPTSPPI